MTRGRLLRLVGPRLVHAETSECVRPLYSTVSLRCSSGRVATLPVRRRPSGELTEMRPRTLLALEIAVLMAVVTVSTGPLRSDLRTMPVRVALPAFFTEGRKTRIKLDLNAQNPREMYIELMKDKDVPDNQRLAYHLFDVTRNEDDEIVGIKDASFVGCFDWIKLVKSKTAEEGGSTQRDASEIYKVTLCRKRNGSDEAEDYESFRRMLTEYPAGLGSGRIQLCAVPVDFQDLWRFGTADPSKLRSRKDAPHCRGYILVDRAPFEHTARMLYDHMIDEFKEMGLPLDPGLTKHGIDGTIVMFTFDKDKCEVEGITSCQTGVALCDISFSIGLTRSRNKVESGEGDMVTPWVLEVKCFALKVRDDLPGFQLNAREVGYHGVSTGVDIGLEVPMSLDSLVSYYKLACAGIEGITQDDVALYFKLMYSDDNEKVTKDQATALELVHKEIQRIKEEPTVAKSHSVDSVKQRTNIARDVRRMMGASQQRDMRSGAAFDEW